MQESPKSKQGSHQGLKVYYLYEDSEPKFDPKDEQVIAIDYDSNVFY